MPELVAEILHILIDVVSGARNLAAHDAQALHEKITPGYGAAPVSADALAAAQKVIDLADLQRAEAAATSPGAATVDDSAASAQAQAGLA